jgi:probable addiction module antidote protein
MKEIKLQQFDAADYLEGETDIASFMQAAMEDGGDDPAYIARCLGVVARAHSMNQLARETGLSRQNLYTALSGEGDPRLSTLLKIAKAMGLRISFNPA